MLEGVLTLQTGDMQSSLHPGDLARFKAEKLHTFSNRGDRAARYLVIKRQA